MGDSFASGYPSDFKIMIEEEFEGRVNVRILDYHEDGQYSSEILEALRMNEELREAIRNAEIITIEVPLGVCRVEFTLYNKGGSCGGEDNQDCMRECTAIYKSETEQILAEFVALRTPVDAAFRVHDPHQFGALALMQNGTFDVNNSYLKDINAHLIAVAEGYGIPVARVYHAFMGPDGDRAPTTVNLVLPDEIHSTLAGQRLIAE